MRKSRLIWLILAIFLTVGASLSNAGCDGGGKENEPKGYVYKEGDFSLQITVDKTEIFYAGEKVKVTAAFKNLSGRDLPILYFDRENGGQGSPIENIISTALIFSDREWNLSEEKTPFRKILEKDASLEVSETYTATKFTEYEARAVARFYYIPDEAASDIEAAKKENLITVAGEIVPVSINTEFFEVEAEGMVVPNKSYSFFGSESGLRILLNYTEEGIVYECTLDKGRFYLKPWQGLSGSNFGKRAVVNFIYINTVFGGMDDYIFADPYESGIGRLEQIFVEIVIKKDNNIIGYAVVEIYQSEEPYFYYSNLLASNLFLKPNGMYHYVTEEYVKEAIEKVKSNK